MSEEEALTANLLSPEELEALSEGVKDGSVPVDTGYNTEARVTRHDLANEDSTLGVNVSSLDMINERFIRLFRLGLVEVLRTSLKMNATRAEIIQFGTYLQGLKPPLSVNVLRMHPLRGFSMIIIEPTVIFSALDNFFGGFGKGVGDLPSGRLFTPTENRIINMILDLAFKSLREAWSPLMELDFEHSSSEINPQFAQIAAESDLVIHTRFESDSPGQDSSGGYIDLVYPYASLKPIRDLLRSRMTGGDGDEESDKQWRDQLASAVGDSQLDLDVTLGELETTYQQFSEIQEGDLLYFKKPDFARVSINDVPVYDAEVGNRGPQTAMRIHEILRPKPVEEREG